MRVLVCGSRDWTDIRPIRTVLCGLVHRFGYPFTVVHGAARGADHLAGVAAFGEDMTIEEFPADWTQHGRSAGFIRNQQMIDTGPDVVWAFKTTPESVGTNHTISLAKAAGIPVYVVMAG